MFEVVMAENVPIIVKPQIQVAQRTPRRMNTKKQTNKINLYLGIQFIFGGEVLFNMIL